jgi:hypothetical protein
VKGLLVCREIVDPDEEDMLVEIEMTKKSC